MLSQTVWGGSCPYPGGTGWGAGRNPIPEMTETSDPLGCVSVCEIRCLSSLGQDRGVGSWGAYPALKHSRGAVWAL